MNNNFLIEESDIEHAQNICSEVEEISIRNRAVANTLAAKIATKYFTDDAVDTDSGLHNIKHVMNDLDISDIYIKDSYIDVRLYFEDHKLLIPKEHFDKNLLPVAYMFIKIDEEISNGYVAGFITPDRVNKDNTDGKYIAIEEDELISYYDIMDLIQTKYEEDIPDDFDVKIFNYIDGTLEDKNEFFRLLISSKYLRAQLRNASKAQILLSKVTYDNSAMADESLPEEDFANNDELPSLEADDTFAVEVDDELPSLEADDTFAVEVDDELPSLEADDTFAVEVDDELPSLEADDSFAIEVDDELPSLDADDTFAVEVDDELPSLETDDTFAVEVEDELPSLETYDTISFSEESIEEDVPQEQVQDLEVEEYNSGNIDNTFFSEENDFSTETTPSINSIEAEDFSEVSGFNIEELSDAINEAKEQNDFEYVQESSPEATYYDNSATYLEEPSNIEDSETQVLNSENINTLYEKEEDSYSEYENDFNEAEQIVKPNKQSPKIIPLLGTVVLIGALGYFGYTKYTEYQYNNSEQSNEIVKTESIPTKPAMPIETVENIKPVKNTNEGNAISIPAIEKNLDASINVENLSVSWEVPSTYISNNTAQKYFKKIGKIIQLNLKAELLLLTKPPITNKIMLELEFNKKNNKFEVKNIATSSGEKSVDNLIMQTVKNSLDLNIRTNMSIFNNLTGNPVLVIRL